MTNKKILILGADKMLGHFLVSQLSERLGDHLALARQNELDFYNMQDVTAFISQYSPDTLVSLLGKSGGISLNQAIPADLMVDNLLMTLNVMRACHILAIQKAIFLGSSCMYPRDASQPMQEKILFSGYLEPTSQSYAVAKLAGLQLCEAFNQQYGTHFICIIPSTIYGPHDDFNLQSAHVVGALMHKFHQAQRNQSSEVTVWGSGLASRELIYVDDVAQAVIRCFSQEITEKMNPINVSSGSAIPIKALAEKIADTVGFSGQILWDRSRSDGVAQKCLDNRKLMSLGWSPQVSLETGLALTYEWYLSAHIQREANDKISV